MTILTTEADLMWTQFCIQSVIWVTLPPAPEATLRNPEHLWVHIDLDQVG